MAATRQEGRPRRRIPATKFTVTIPDALGEWAKREPEGLSGLVANLLVQEKLRRSLAEPTDDTARAVVLAAEPALARIWDTPEEDEAWRHL